MVTKLLRPVVREVVVEGAPVIVELHPDGRVILSCKRPKKVLASYTLEDMVDSMVAAGDEDSVFSSKSLLEQFAAALRVRIAGYIAPFTHGLNEHDINLMAIIDDVEDDMLTRIEEGDLPKKVIHKNE